MYSVKIGLSPELAKDAVVLFLTALGNKYLPVLGDKNKAINFLIKNANFQNCLSVTEEGKLLGLLAMRTKKNEFINFDYKKLKEEYGVIGGLIKKVKIFIFKYVPKDFKEMHIEYIIVDELARGKGIGTKLIGELINLAKNQGYTTVTLEVIGTNQRALKLYKNLGFQIENSTNIWPLNKIIGWNFDDVIFMKKILAN